MLRLTIVIILMSGVCLTVPAFGWLGPVNVSYDSNPGGGDFFPDMAGDSLGNLHMVWCDLTADGNWHIRHRIKYANNTWSTITLVSTGQTSTYWVRCAMDAGDNLHVAWHNGSSQTTTDVYYRKQFANGTWGTVTNLSNSGSIGSLYPDIAVDGLGRVFVAWHEAVNGWDVGMAVFDGTAWQPPQMVVSTVGIDAYPVLAIDAANTLHMAWTQDYEDIYYRTRSAAGAWSGAVNLSHNAGSSRDPHIAVASDGTPHVVWHDNTPGNWEYFYATKVGGSWQGSVNLSNSPDIVDSYGAVAVSPDGSVHVVWQDYQNVYYSRKTGATWPVATLLYASNQTKHAVVYVDASADAHIAWQNKPSGQEWDVLYMMKDYPDQTAPAPVAAFTAVAGNTQVFLTWTNPNDLDFAGTMVRFKTTGYPTNSADGTLLYDQSMVRGGGGATTHSGLTNGVTYYYAAFSYDDSHNYAAGQTASATPALLVDHDRDGDVDQSDFGPLQACFSGAYTPPVMGCERYDFDYDADVDPDDVGMFSRCFSGAGVYAIPTCTD